MIIEDQRIIHEDIERLEQAIADRIIDDPTNIRDRLHRDHQIAGFLQRIEEQSQRLLDIYKDADKSRAREIQTLSTSDQFETFYSNLKDIKAHHRKYPNEPVENLEKAYQNRGPGENGPSGGVDIDAIFTGEETYGRFFDLTVLHEDYLNLPGVKGGKRVTYPQYLDIFDKFTPPECTVKPPDKMKEPYFQYITALAEYLEGFMRRIRPLEDTDKLLTQFDEEFEKAWASNEIEGWGAKAAQPSKPATSPSEAVYCDDCEKEFGNENTYKAHLNGKKHIRAAEAKKQRGGTRTSDAPGTDKATASIQRLKERAVAEREFRVQKFANAMQTIRHDTRSNVERKQGMTEKERQQELAALFAEQSEVLGGTRDEGEESDDEEKIYNPLKLPLAWDGKPIPYWLYKLHGLGVEFPCEICGNFVYMGRRAFDKHFSEARHIHGLKCLGITNTTLFREITRIQDAINLWDKIQKDKKKEKSSTENVVQMEDAEGNVMPEKVYYDLQKQGLL
ncbi:hypothetical protein P152DRAFT_456982 [Eremomyces bilateralis CBS 781.70]|uniref:Matrin-type domain-containing protein n=1 Tax=Eremomyces bilateralis CBS 781.70 TaxID=1392243 RepID=A0A6G1G6Z6_9PEZI|nr:uncharacterized protein P152DRAFT_456982 [Eremomyces bilateralis CBS 781.70]KAF1813599.1 hypothetical protein P152DRAFT_456982 [Eremomyces bilateralis CBS 781.70]